MIYKQLINNYLQHHIPSRISSFFDFSDGHNEHQFEVLSYFFENWYPGTLI